MASEHTGLDAGELELERELASLLDVERFDPPPRSASARC